MKQASPKPPLCRVNLEVKQITAVFAQEFLFWASVKSKRKQRYLRYQLLVYWLLQQIDSLYFVLLITGANMLNQKSNLHDVVPTSDSSALEHLASNVATNVGTVITAPAPALEAQNAEEDSLPLFLTQAAAQVAAAFNVAGTTATQGVSATPAATALFPEHNATADAITATASANATSTSVAATSDAAIADNDVATDAIVASATEVAMSDPATASDTTADTTTSADTTTATATATVIADNVSVVDANIASPVEVAMSDPATVSDTTTDTTTSSDAAITTTATATATAIADDASVIDSSVASTAEVVMSDPATVSNSNTTLDTTTLDATDATTDIASTTTATTTATSTTTKKGKRSTRAKKPRQPKRTHFPPEPVTNTSEQILSQPKALKQSQLLQVLASSDDEAIQKLLTPQQLAAFSNANANSSTERLEQENKLLGVLLRHRGEDKIFLDTLMQESGMSCDAVTEVMRKLRSLEIIRMYSTYVRFYDLENADVYLNTVVRTNEQRKSYSVKYPQEDIKNGILSVEAAFGFYLLKSRKAISFADFTEVVATACTDLEPVQELLVLLYRCGKVQLQDNVLYFVPKKRIPRKAKSSPTSQGSPAGSPAGGQGLAPNGSVATNGATTPAPAASASGATAESAAPTEGKASVEAMTTSYEPVDEASVAVTVDASVDDTAAIPTEVTAEATATVSESSRIEPVVAVSEVADTFTSLASQGAEQIAAGVTASAVSAVIPNAPSSGSVTAPVMAKTTAAADSCHEHLRPSALATAIASMVTSFSGCSTKPQDGSCVL